MTDDTTVRDVFRTVEPDPDAVLDEFGVESPDDLVAAAEADDSASADDLEIDDSTIAALFDDETTAPDPLEEGATDRPSARADDGDAPAVDAVDDVEFEFGGAADVTVRDDGDVIDDSAAELSAFDAADRPAETAPRPSADVDERDDADAADAARTDPDSRTLTLRPNGADELELAGAEPTTVRIPNETFGTGDAADR